MAMPAGLINRATVPIPSAIPELPATPANVVTTPVGVILRMTCLFIVADIHVVHAVHGNSIRTIESGNAAGAIGTPRYRRSASHWHDAGGGIRIIVINLDVNIARVVDSNSVRVTENERHCPFRQ